MTRGPAARSSAVRSLDAMRLPAWKSVWFQIHWFLGITAGMVLMVVGFTGGMLSFQDEILRALNPGVLTVQPRPEAPLVPAELVRRIESATGGRVASLNIAAAPERPARAMLAPRVAPQGTSQGAPQTAPQAGGRPRRGEMHHVDPWTGALLGTPQGEGFFRTTRELHRWLMAGAEGRIVVGVSTIALVVLSLSGLYLRWPRRPLRWRNWFHLDLRLRGRSLFWRLHSVIGTWVLPLYLLAGLTGLYWSFDWYRSALYAISGAPRPASMAGGGRAPGAPRLAGLARAVARGAPENARVARGRRRWTWTLLGRPSYASDRISAPPRCGFPGRGSRCGSPMSMRGRRMRMRATASPSTPPARWWSTGAMTRCRSGSS